MAHAFEAAMIEAAYLRTIGPEGVEVSLVIYKGKITPLKSFSIPRLELQAALIASRMGNFIMRETDIKLTNVRYWSDSQTVLRWIRSKSVGNRVGAIHELIEVRDWTNSKLFQLAPVLDINGVLCMDSKLANAQMANFRTPVIQDPRKFLTKLIIRHYHDLLLLQGQDTVRNEIRLQFWIPNLRVEVKRCWSECPLCKIRQAKPSTPVMGALPGCRVEPQQRSFSIVGMDYFGPMDISVGRRHEKIYGVLFTCMTTWASISKMICWRVLPLEIFSDNGTNLRGADKELQQSLVDYDQEALTENMNSKGIKWNFNPPSSPHMGGC
ncbi:hypothetical protein LAZ67_X000342 [Cordylochernes scorpioides]|uniref:Integrase zinc-binding domain-containing protein n=1 Tax=Cordylochernes scorpioides TaxID=51811 RepID=A0ABY6LVJ4_9ARAC|nr:hypothetical protein LAZ67_X000342 [Cordylochernes scorpioides]